MRERRRTSCTKPRSGIRWLLRAASAEIGAVVVNGDAETGDGRVVGDMGEGSWIFREDGRGTVDAENSACGAGISLEGIGAEYAVCEVVWKAWGMSSGFQISHSETTA